MGKKQPWENERETSPGGSEIMRHELNDKVINPQLQPFGMHQLSNEDMDAITLHVERHVGKVDKVFHEIMSDDLHIDVNWVKPNERCPVNFLCTMGMSALAMNVPKKYKAPKFAELCIYLPAKWPLSQEAFKKHGEDFYWPIRWLKNLARMPNQFDTFLGDGHTVPYGDPPEQLSPHCPFVGFAIISALDPKFATLKLGKREVAFYMLVPLFPEEMQLKLDKGMDELIDRLESAAINPHDLANPKRKNVAK